MSSTKTANKCEVCGEVLPYLDGRKSATSTWKQGKEYHKVCYYSTLPDFKCQVCGLTFPPSEATKYREHWLVAHKPAGEIADVKMYIPDGMINDANMEQVLKENEALKASRVDCLRVCAEWLKSINVPYFISDGTMLGAFRENGKMIGTDIDSDVSILEKDMETLLNNAHLLPEGYLLDTCSCNIDWSTQINKPFDGVGAKKFTLVDVRDYSHIVKETQAPETDIYSFRVDEEDSNILRNNYAKPNQAVHNCRWHKDWIFPLKEYYFEGLTLTGPCDPLNYLKELYGYIGHNAFWNPDTKKYEKLPNTPSDPYE